MATKKFKLYVDVTLKMSTCVEVEASTLSAAKDLIRDRKIAQNLLDQIHADTTALEDSITGKKVWRHEKE